MAQRRDALRLFALANAAYRNGTVVFYKVDPLTLDPSAELATIYNAPVGGDVVANPYRLDSNGAAFDTLYYDEPVIAVINQSDVGSTKTGIVTPNLGTYAGDWEPSVVYPEGTIVRDGVAGANSGNLYLCLHKHTSSVWQDDLPVQWQVFVDFQSIGSAVVASTNNAQAAIEARGAAVAAATTATAAALAAAQSADAASNLTGFPAPSTKPGAFMASTANGSMYELIDGLPAKTRLGLAPAATSTAALSTVGFYSYSVANVQYGGIAPAPIAGTNSRRWMEGSYDTSTNSGNITFNPDNTSYLVYFRGNSTKGIIATLNPSTGRSTLLTLAAQSEANTPVTGAQGSTAYTLTPNPNTSPHSEITLNGASATIANPTTPDSRNTDQLIVITIKIKQDATGGWIPTFGPKFRNSDGGLFTMQAKPANTFTRIYAEYDWATQLWYAQENNTWVL